MSGSKQLRLGFGSGTKTGKRSRRSSLSEIAGQYEEQNREAAEIILADVEKYGGSKGSMAHWARVLIARKDGTTSIAFGEVAA